MGTIRRALLSVAMVCVLCSFAPADDVIVKTVRPDSQSPASQPDENQLGPGMQQILSGDHRVDTVLRLMKLTGDEMAKVLVAVQPFAKTHAELGKPIDDLRREYQAKVESAGPADAPAVRAMLDRLYAMMRERQAQADRDREKLVAAVVGALGQERGQAFRKLVEEHDPSTPAYARRMAAGMLPAIVHGVELTEAQKSKAIDLIQARQAEFRKQIAAANDQQVALEKALAEKPNDPDLLKRQSALLEQRQKESRDVAMATRSAVEELLTPEQRQKSAESRRKLAEASADAILRQVMAALSKTKLTAEQAGKVKDLTTGARESLSKIDPFDPYSREELGKQLRRDIKAMLTDEQKAALKGVPNW